MRMPGTRLRVLCVAAVVLLAGGLTAGCGSQAGGAGQPALAMADLHAMPMDVQEAPVAVQQAYQFAVANPELLSEIPCYCGCGGLGHKSNYDCYVAGVTDAGDVAFDEHALACSICVDITQDTMRLLRQGKTLAETRQYVDTTYSRYGPSNIP
jgi:hypothetical protein